MTLRNDQLSGAVGDFVRAIALGSLNMADARRTACAILGIPQPNPQGTVRVLIAHMEQLDTLTCEDYDPDMEAERKWIAGFDDYPEPGVELLNLPSSRPTRHGGAR